jgi:hypothetical protein
MMSSPRLREPGDAFGRHVALAARRGRLEQLALAAPRIAWTLAVALLLVLVLALATPLVAWAFEIAATCLLLTALGALYIYGRKVQRHRLLTRMDLHAQLPDAVLTTGDWENDAPDAWREGQRRATLRALEQIQWKTAWPVAWPSRSTLPLVSALILVLAIGLLHRQWHAQHRVIELAEAKTSAPVPKDQLQPLNDVFKDWDAAQKIAPSPELAALLKDVQPLREQMEDGKLTEKQLLLKLNDVQAELAAQREKLEAQSLEPAAQAMADAVRNLDAMSALAAALERKDFAAAHDQADQAQQKYSSGDAKMPEAQAAQTGAQKLGDAAQQAAANSNAASSLRQMQDSLGKKDGSQMSKGLSGLKGSLAQEAERQGQGRSNDIEMSQLNAIKDGLGQGNKPGDGTGNQPGQDGNNPGGRGMQLGPPQLSLARSLQPGQGAGNTTDPNHFGAKTELADHTNQVKLTGTPGQGPSETQNESTNDPHLEKTASSISAPQFSAYEKLSEHAIDDENLPVADRQMIKRYFEEIRPAGNH